MIFISLESQQSYFLLIYQLSYIIQLIPLNQIKKKMINKSSNSSPEQNLFQRSASNEHLKLPNFKRISNSLQYLDKVRSLKPNNEQNNKKLIKPFEKYIQPQQITYIDNQKLYGIVKVLEFNKLKLRVGELNQISEKNHFQLHQKNLKIITLQKQLQFIKQKQLKNTNIIHTLQQALEQNNQKRLLDKKIIMQKTQIVQSLIENKNELERQLNIMENQLIHEKFKRQKQSSQNAHKRICESQTEYIIPQINIPEFDPKLQQILKQLCNKRNEKIDQPTLKQIIQQSLQSFVKGLEEQYKLIKDQSIDLQGIKSQNNSLKEQNQKFKRIIHENQIDEEKLSIFKACLMNFLKDTNQKITDSIQTERKQAKDLQILNTRKISDQNMSHIQRRQTFKQKQKQIPQANLTKKTKLIQQIQTNQPYTSSLFEMKFLKEENLRLLKTLGEYQYKWKNIDNILNQNNQKDQITDDGTVGQLVKMSKLVKEAVKSLLQEI